MEELLKKIQDEFNRVQERNDRSSSALKKVETIVNNDEISDADKVKEIRNFVEEYIARYILWTDYNNSMNKYIEGN